jgi:hypothetical protein
MQLESNEREIQGGMILRIDKYEGYDFHQEAGFITCYILEYYEVQGYDSDGNFILRENNNPNYFIVKPQDSFERIELTIDVLNQWGADDQIIFDYAAEKLGVTLV